MTTMAAMVNACTLHTESPYYLLCLSSLYIYLGGGDLIGMLAYFMLIASMLRIRSNVQTIAVFDTCSFATAMYICYVMFTATSCSSTQSINGLYKLIHIHTHMHPSRISVYWINNSYTSYTYICFIITTVNKHIQYWKMCDACRNPDDIVVT